MNQLFIRQSNRTVTQDNLKELIISSQKVENLPSFTFSPFYNLKCLLNLRETQL